MYRLAPSELQGVQRQVTDLLGKKLIEPSKTNHGAPIMFVEKNTGDLRMVVDYRAVNKVTINLRTAILYLTLMISLLCCLKDFFRAWLQEAYGGSTAGVTSPILLDKVGRGPSVKEDRRSYSCIASSRYASWSPACKGSFKQHSKALIRFPVRIMSSR